MNALAALATPFLGRPWAILLVAFIFLGLDRLDRGGATDAARPPRARPALRVVSLLWAGLAAWEALVLLFTPEANIRVDWLILWPLLLLTTLLSLVSAGLSAFRHR